MALSAVVETGRLGVAEGTFNNAGKRMVMGQGTTAHERLLEHIKRPFLDDKTGRVVVLDVVHPGAHALLL